MDVVARPTVVGGTGSGRAVEDFGPSVPVVAALERKVEVLVAPFVLVAMVGLAAVPWRASDAAVGAYRLEPVRVLPIVPVGAAESAFFTSPCDTARPTPDPDGRPNPTDFFSSATDADTTLVFGTDGSVTGSCVGALGNFFVGSAAGGGEGFLTSTGLGFSGSFGFDPQIPLTILINPNPPFGAAAPAPLFLAPGPLFRAPTPLLLPAAELLRFSSCARTAGESVSTLFEPVGSDPSAVEIRARLAFRGDSVVVERCGGRVKILSVGSSVVGAGAVVCSDFRFLACIE